jgi:hypothetical protein
VAVIDIHAGVNAIMNRFSQATKFTYAGLFTVTLATLM